jgi:nucleoside 2-deoxyribosyltransferase
MPLAQRLRKKLGIEIFDNWIAPGPRADDFWRDYSKIKGLTYKQALASWEAKHIFEFDKFHIDRADAGLVVMPVGKSGHLEAGYMRGQGKPVWALFDSEPKRYDVMAQFFTEIFFKETELYDTLRKHTQKT